MELGKDALQFVVNTPASENEMVATQLSQVLPWPANSPRTLPVAAARRIAQELAKGTAKHNSLPGTGLVMWAPAEQAALGRMLAQYIKTIGERDADYCIRMVVPMDTFPGCSSMEAIQDLF